VVFLASGWGTKVRAPERGKQTRREAVRGHHNVCRASLGAHSVLWQPSAGAPRRRGDRMRETVGTFLASAPATARWSESHQDRGQKKARRGMRWVVTIATATVDNAEAEIKVTTRREVFPATGVTEYRDRRRVEIVTNTEMRLIFKCRRPPARSRKRLACKRLSLTPASTSTTWWQALSGLRHHRRRKYGGVALLAGQSLEARQRSARVHDRPA